MTFQNTVRNEQATGLPGEWAKSGPRRVNPKYLNSADPSLNIIGRAFQQSITPNDNGVEVDSGVPGLFAGILGFPKNYALNGNQAAGSLSPSYVLPNNTEVEMIREGTIYAVVNSNSGAGNFIGDALVYDYSTGQIISVPAGTTPGSEPSGTLLIPNGAVTERHTSDGELTVIYLNAQG